MFRTLEKYQYGVDVAIAAVYFLASVGVFGRFYGYYYEGSLVGDGGFAFVIGGYALALALRRISPGLALGIAWAFSVAQMALVVEPSVYNVATCAVLFTTAAYGSRTVRTLGLISIGVGAFVAAADHVVRLSEVAHV